MLAVGVGDVDWEAVNSKASGAFAEDNGGPPATIGQLDDYVRLYLKPVLVAHAAGLAGVVALSKDINYSELARRLHFKDGTSVRVQVSAISFLKPASGINDLAQIRFIRFIRPGGVGEERATHWIATLQYAWAKPPTDDRQRAINPLGFRVVDYRKEAEVVVEPAAPAAPTGPGQGQ